MIKSTFFNFLPRLNILLINQISMLIVIPWLALNLSSLYFGYIATGLIIIQLGWILVSSGFLHYVTEIWDKKDNKDIHNELITNIVASKIIFFVIYILIILFLIYFNFIDLSLSIFFVIFINLIVGGIYPLWFYNIYNQTSLLIKSTLVSRVIFLILVFIFVQSDGDMILFFLIQGISFLITTIHAFHLISKKFKLRIYKFCKYQSFLHYKKCFPFMINSLTNNYLNTLWGFSITIALGPISAGIYSIADQIYRATSAITNTISQVLRANVPKKVDDNLFKSIIIIITIYLLFTACGIFLAQPLITYFFNPDFYMSIPLIKIMLATCFFQSCSKLISYPLIGQLIGYRFLNKTGTVFLLLNIIVMFFWYFYLQELILAINIFLVMSLFHFSTLLIFLYLFNFRKL